MWYFVFTLSQSTSPATFVLNSSILTKSNFPARPPERRYYPQASTSASRLLSPLIQLGFLLSLHLKARKIAQLQQFRNSRSSLVIFESYIRAQKVRLQWHPVRNAESIGCQPFRVNVHSVLVWLHVNVLKTNLFLKRAKTEVFENLSV